MKMRMRELCAAVALVAAPASANDSTAETGAGGLVLTRSDTIDMVSEDLFVSAEQVRVRYVFHNRGAGDLRVTVAFPMPDRDLSAEEFGDVAYPSDFETRVEGAPVAMRVERKAMLKGRDVTAQLAALRVPVSGDGIGKALDALTPAQGRSLERLGLARTEEYDAGRGMERHLSPLWTIRETWCWEQDFPADRDLRVEHAYHPGTGSSVGTGLNQAGFPTLARRSADDRPLLRRRRLPGGYRSPAPCGESRLCRASRAAHRLYPEDRRQLAGADR
jgi:hypothetical protein